MIFGTSSLGNLYTALRSEVKTDIIKQIINNSKLAVFDTAGKYGAGMALEVLGKGLTDMQVHQEDVLISNKLGWLQTPLIRSEPTFEKDVWVDLRHDAVQKINYEGILECFEQGNKLLGKFKASMVSVHDPDEYLAASVDLSDYKKKYKDIMDAYRGLYELKAEGKVKSVGIGAKDWRVIKKISTDIALDWVMFANSLTLHTHPQDLLNFIHELSFRGTQVINSAVFNGGFLVGGDYYNYAPVDPSGKFGIAIFKWRESFFKCCRDFEVKPAEACCEFGMNFPGITSIALNTSKPENVSKNIAMGSVQLPKEFWKALSEQGLIRIAF